MLIRSSLITRPFGLFEQRSCFTNYRVPSRLVRYGIVYGSAAHDALEDIDPHAQLRELSKETNDMLKAGAKSLAARIATFIELLESYEEATDDTPKEPEPKAKKRTKR